MGAQNQENFGEISLLQLSRGDNQLGKIEEEHDIGHWQGVAERAGVWKRARETIIEAASKALPATM